MKSVFSIIFLAAALILSFKGTSLFVQAEHLQLQETRMHELALRHRSYEPMTQWKHDERSLLARKKEKRVYGMTSFVSAVGALFISFVLWQAARKEWARRSWESPTVYSVSDDTPTESVPIVEPTLERSLDEKKNESGKRGEREIYDTLAPLFTEGWTLVARNPRVEIADRNFGDVDFVLRGPSGVGVSLDAKNGNLYAWLHNGNLYFKDRWYTNADGTPKQWHYPSSRAWELADWVKERYGFATVRPVICLAKLVTARKLGRINGVDVVKAAELCDCLRKVDAYHHERRWAHFD